MKVIEKIESVLIIVLMLAIGLICMNYAGKKSDYERQIRDLEVQLAQSEQKADTFIIRDSIPVFKERVVEVDRTDYTKILADKELIKDLKLKVKEIEAENRILLSTRDTVVLEPTFGDSILTYSDHWNRFSYELNSRVLDWEVRDSLVTYVSTQYRHHFLWWRWGKNGYEVTHVNFNPKSKIVYSKYIKIK